MQSRSWITHLAAALFTLFSANAGAVIIDFIKLTEGGHGNPVLAPRGESAWSVLSVPEAFGMKVRGHANKDVDSYQFAYLDWGKAGLGVCKDAINVDSNALGGSAANQCSPASDDNVTNREYLKFMFDQDVVVENLWFNNNHDGGLAKGDMVDITTIGMGTMSYALMTGYAPGSPYAEAGMNGIGSFFVAAGNTLKVAFDNQQFYISAIEVNAVPLPAAVWLFASAIAGLAGFGRRRRVAA